MIRKLYTFTTPGREEGKDGKYTIGYGYYDKFGNSVGISVRAELTEDELYNILKPYLKRKDDWRIKKVK